jgi:hypothetical protein
MSNWGFAAPVPMPETDASGFWSDDDSDEIMIRDDGEGSDFDDGFGLIQDDEEKRTRQALLDTENELYKAADELYSKMSSSPNLQEEAATLAKVVDTDDPREAMTRWYAEQERASKPPFEEWVRGFFFLRVVGSSIPIPKNITPLIDADDDEEIFAQHTGDDECDCAVHGGLRHSLKEALVDSLMEALVHERAKQSSKKGEHEIRIASVSKYVAGSRG